MEQEIECLQGLAHDLADIDITPNGSWVGVGGSADAREIVFNGQVVRTALACRFPLVCALDSETAVLVDGRTSADRPNAWVVRANGAQTAQFAVGDAVMGLTSVRGRLVVTHFDEGYGNDLHGMLVFDPKGELQLNYRRDIAGACEIVDCYAASPSGGDRILLLIYPEFVLAEVDVARRTQVVWSAPGAVHGAAAISACGRTVYFHAPYADRTAVYAWQRGEREASRIASFEGRLQGLGDGWFLTRQSGQFARVRFGTSSTAA